jgi:ATP-dependent DNA ligase
MGKFARLQPKLVAEIACAELAPSRHLRHAKFLGFREDKEPEKVRIETSSAEASEETEDVLSTSGPFSEGRHYGARNAAATV